MKKLLIDGSSLKISDVVDIANDLDAKIQVELDSSAKEKVNLSREFIEKKLNSGEAIYGVSTGFGVFSQVRINQEKLDQLQINLIRSHAVGIGKPLSEQEVRASVLLRANTLAQGHSGVSVGLIEALLAMLNSGVHPWVPEQGSVGASGDLAPLAHLAMVLIGEGRAFYKGKLLNARQALNEAGLKPYRVLPKEGLSLINGTQVMTAIGALAFDKAKRLSKISDIAAAMSVEAFAGSVAPFDERISKARSHPGQIAVASHMRVLLEGSEIIASHADCDRIQDPYSFRCVPQVHGICRDTLMQVEKILEIEINSVTDNPLVFLDGEEGRIINGGNFHGEYVAIAMDQMAVACAEYANISEQRLQKLINPAFSSGLPPFLVSEGGLNSGFMIIQVAAASLVSENKSLAHPASVDSIPTSADKEDHVSMGTIAARKARSIVENTWNVLTMEIFAASQGLEFRKPLKPSKTIQKYYDSVREVVSFVTQDRAFYEDIEKLSKKVSTW